MANNRMVKNTSTGEVFIETPRGDSLLWHIRFKRWLRDHSKPCPLPDGHKVFVIPHDYGCVLIENDKPKLI